MHPLLHYLHEASTLEDVLQILNWTFHVPSDLGMQQPYALPP